MDSDSSTSAQNCRQCPELQPQLHPAFPSVISALQGACSTPRVLAQKGHHCGMQGHAPLGEERSHPPLHTWGCSGMQHLNPIPRVSVLPYLIQIILDFHQNSTYFYQYHLPHQCLYRWLICYTSQIHISHDLFGRSTAVGLQGCPGVLQRSCLFS